jgi:hypothetical protein
MIPALWALFGSIISWLIDKAFFKTVVRVAIIATFLAALYFAVNSLFVFLINKMASVVISAPSLSGAEFMYYCIPSNIPAALSVVLSVEIGVKVAQWSINALSNKFKLLGNV